MNHRLHALWIALVIALAAGPPAMPVYAANDKTPAHPPTRQVSTEQGSLELSGVDVKKGDLQETVMRQLSQLYQLQKLRSAQGEEDSWLIAEKAEPDNYVGVVSFDSGRVRRVAGSGNGRKTTILSNLRNASATSGKTNTRARYAGQHHGS